MLSKGIDTFFTPTERDSPRVCRACGSTCKVRRAVNGPTGFVEAMGGRSRPHDQHACPHAGQAWHDRAVQLTEAIDTCPSDRVKALMQADRDDLIRSDLT